MERDEYSRFRPNTVVKLAFRTLSNKEVTDLSVAKLITPLTFNALGHPLPGGLYDPKLGPIESMGVCQTCCNVTVKCPGHVGHIELPLPVVNPVYHKIVSNVLKMSCLSCYRVLILPEIKSLLISQIKLLDAGLVVEALELADTKVSPASSWSRTPDNTMVENTEIYKMEVFVEEALKKNLLVNEVIEVRGDGNYRADFLKFATSYICKLHKCPYCNNRWRVLSVVGNKIFISQLNVEVADKFTRKEKKAVTGQSWLTPSDCMTHFRKLYNNDSDFIKAVIPGLIYSREEHKTDMLFMMNLLVTPTNMRPVNRVGGVMTEHPINHTYKSVLNACLTIRTLIHFMNNKTDTKISSQRLDLIKLLRGETNSEKLNYAWQELQSNIDGVLDSELSSKEQQMNGLGLKQIIEKKEGIIRKNMMGKRVNFAGRSVITPDPNLAIDEIGIPEEFAKKLTFPCPVTEWNVTELRKKVINGPEIHPGANLIQNDDGSIVKLDPKDLVQREGVAKKLLTLNNSNGIKVLHRHLVNGDILLVNRQPTLHKPSIMAHKARILKGEKTLRLHYANCKSYNADFDGDEMNVHFPQNEVARSEGYNLVGVCHQYLVPKDGTPLSGLIQDHVVSAVRMTIRGRFFNRSEYMQLVFQGLSFVVGDIKLLPPCIVKPCQLWSGKQIISTLIINTIPKGKALINLKSTSKISCKAWGSLVRKPKAGGTPLDQLNMSESEVIIRNGELLCGVLDKTQFGSSAYSLIHCMYELYGGETSSKLLSSFSKLFTSFLQREGFTLGVKDILTTASADKKRHKIIKAARKIGNLAASKALDIPESQVTALVLQEENNKDKQFRNVLDREYKVALDQYTNEINKTCLAEGLLSTFPENNLQLMVQSGAKGSTVNTMQISCLLGQIELEGKRPPVMISGRSLPSFRPYETIPRSGGFIDGRFMTGIKPQEFFFHCMAGREGLIDTAVKTSRSGYLQRCLIKHLEGLTVAYDSTVRDSDNSVIQFLYGEDGLDITQSQFLKSSQIHFLVDNIAALTNSGESISKQVKSCKKKLAKWMKQNGDFCFKRGSPFASFSNNYSNGKISNHLKNGRSKDTLKIIDKWNNLSPEEKAGFMKAGRHAPETIQSQYQPDKYFGSISEKLDSIIDKYVNEHGDKKRVRKVMYTKCLEGSVAPGEPVGLLAAQSVGEPSTQMTLNTFHFAGRGEMNVTLGIPRLRELLMVASKQIKTPTMTIPFLPDIPEIENKANRLRKYLNRVTLSDVLESIIVTEKLEISPLRKQVYILRMKFLPREVYRDLTHLKPQQIISYVEKKFVNELTQNIARRRKMIQTIVTTETSNKKQEDDKEDEDEQPGPQRGKKGGIEEVVESSDDEQQNDDDDATADRRRERQNNDQQYDDIEDIEDEEMAGEVAKDEMEWAVDDPQPAESPNDPDGPGDASGDDGSSATKLSVVKSNIAVEKYKYDSAKYSWCEITLSYDVGCKSIDLLPVLKELASKSVITQVPGIRKAAIMNEGGKLVLKTDGLNVAKMIQFSDLVDLDKLYSNDVHAVAALYGIEAARHTLVNEIINVFKVYGIDVDRRHLTLIADYMTWDGVYRPLNRKGMEASVSPFQQATFESSLTTLKGAVCRGRVDNLTSPSSRLIAGLPVKSGTGYFDVIQPLQSFWT